MFFVRSKYNPELFVVRASASSKHPLSYEADCHTSSGIYERFGKKYIVLHIAESSEYTNHMRDVDHAMRVFFKRDKTQHETPEQSICAKIPFRYGKFEIKVSDEDHFWRTTEDVQPGAYLKVELELSSVFDYGMNWVVRHITILKK